MRAIRPILIAVAIIALIVSGLFVTGNLPAFPIILASSSNAPFDHFVLLILENHSICDILISCGGSAVFLSSLVQSGALASHYTGIDHPSEPNYLAIASGLAGDCNNPSPNI